MSISFSGLASGLDTSSWVKSLVALKQAKVTVLEEEKEKLTLSRDTLTSIRSFFSSFRSMIEKVTDTRFNIATMDIFAQNLATSANLGVLTASATTEAQEGKYNIKVDKLASNTTATSSYRTRYQETTIATVDSKLKDLGVNRGGIGVTVDGIEYGVRIEEDDTILSFIEKLSEIGVSATFNPTTGVFSMDVGADDIRELDPSNPTLIKEKFHLEGVNEGYKNNSVLQVETVTTVYESATGATKITDLYSDAGAIPTGNVVLDANGRLYTLAITGTSTIDSFISDLASKNITATYENGLFTLHDAVIVDDGTNANNVGSELVNALGLTPTVSKSQQSSNPLTYQTTITVSDTATGSTKLSELGYSGGNFTVKNSSGQTKTINVTSNTTIDEILTQLTNAGLSASIDEDGIVEISGGTLNNGTFDVLEALNLNSDPYTAMVTGNALTETIEVKELVTLNTRLVEDMGVRRGYIEVVDSEGNLQYMKIYDGMTVNDLMNELHDYHLDVEFDSETGVLQITGGSFNDLTDTEVNSLIGNGTIRETDVRYQQGSDLISALYGPDGVTYEETEVAGTFSRTRALYRAVTNTYGASLTSSLESISLTQAGTAVFDVRGERRTINVTKTDTIEGLMNKLNAVGIASSYDTIHSQMTIENATLVGGTSDLDDVLNLETSISGMYVSSNNIYTSFNVTTTTGTTETGDTVVHEKEQYAEMHSVIKDFITTNPNTTITILDKDGHTVTTITANTNGTFEELFAQLSNVGIQGTISEGVVTLTSNDGAYAEGALLDAMGIVPVTETIMTTFTTGMSTTSTKTVTYQTTLAAGMDSIVSDYCPTDWTGTKNLVVKNSDGTAIATVGVTATMTFEQMFDKLSTHGIQGTVADGVVSLTSNNGSYVVDANGSNLLSLMGVESNTTIVTVTIGESVVGTIVTHASTVPVTMTGSQETTSITYTATMASTIGAYTTLSGNKSFTVMQNGTGVNTITINTTNATFEDLFNSLATCGIQGTIADGIITLTSTDGRYVTSDALDALGIAAPTTQTVTTTIGLSETSTNTITYLTTTGSVLSSTSGVTATTIITAESSSIIDQFVDIGTDNSEWITVYQSGTAIGSYQITGTTTFEDLFLGLSTYNIQGTIDDGMLSFTSNDPTVYLQSSFLDNLGLTVTTTTETTYTTSGVSETSTVILEYTTTAGKPVSSTIAATATVTTTAGMASTINDFKAVGDDGQWFTIMENGTAKTSIQIIKTSTFEDLFTALSSHGIQGTISDGVISLTSNDPTRYVTSGFLEELGLDDAATVVTSKTVGMSETSSGVVTYTITTTTGKPVSSSDTVTATVTTTAGMASTINDFKAVGDDGQWFTIMENGTAKTSIQIIKTSTFEDLFTALSSHGIQGTISDGVISLTSNDPTRYVTSGFLEELGLDDAATVVTSKTVGMSETSSVVVTYTITTTTGKPVSSSATVTASVTETAGMASSVAQFTSKSGWQNITVHQNGKADDTFSISISATTTFEDLFTALSSHGIQGTISDGVVMLTSTDGKWATGDIITAMGITTKSEATQIITTGAAGTGTAITYTQTIGQSATGTLNNVSVTYTAGMSSTINDFKTIDNADTTTTTETQRTLTIKDSGTGVGTVTITTTSTFEDMFTALSSLGIQGTISDGVVMFTSTDGRWVESDFLDELGLTLKTEGTASSGEVGITMVGSVKNVLTGISTVGEEKTYSTTLVATTDTLIDDIIGTDTTIADGEIPDSILDKTLAELNLTGTNYGVTDASGNFVLNLATPSDQIKLRTIIDQIEAETDLEFSMQDGKIVYTSASGYLLAGSLAVNLNTKEFSSDRYVTINQYGTDVATFTVAQTATIDDLLTTLAGYGISGNLSDTGVLTFDSVDGTTASGAILEELGITTVPGEGTTVGMNATSTVQAKYTYSKLADATTKLGALGYSDGATLTVTQTNTIGFMNPVSHVDTTGLTRVSELSLSNTISPGTYAISTTEDLVKLSHYCDEAYGDTTGCTFILTNDIDMSDVSNFFGIGRDSAFEGTFDGNGYVIKNLTIRDNGYDAGLFAYTNGATIKNLGITGADINGYANAGILVGSSTGNNTITNCYTEGTVTASQTYASGLVGNNSSGTLNVNNCAVYDIKASAYRVASAFVNNTGTLSGSNNYINYTYLDGGTNQYVIGGSGSSTLNYLYLKGSNTNSVLLAPSGKSITRIFKSTDTTYLDTTGYTVTAQDFTYQSLTSATITLAGTDTLATLISKLNNYGFSAELANGIIDIDEPGNGYEITSTFLRDIGMTDNGLQLAPIETTNGKIVSESAIIVTVTQTQTADFNTTLGEMGIDTDYIFLNATGTMLGPPSAFLTTGSHADTSSYTKLSEATTTQITSGATFKISNVEDLESLQDWVEAGKTFSGVTLILSDNIDASTYTGGPIGNATARFSGTFDGNRYVISNLSINNSSDGYTGLFGYTNNATIKNLGLVDASVTSNYSSGTNYVGGLVGMAASTEVDNCFVDGSITTSDGAGMLIGGLIGRWEYNGTSKTIKNSWTHVDTTGGYYVGGLIGETNYEITITSCKTFIDDGFGSGAAVSCGVIGYTSANNLINSVLVSATGGNLDYVLGTTSGSSFRLKSAYNTYHAESTVSASNQTVNGTTPTSTTDVYYADIFAVNSSTSLSEITTKLGAKNATIENGQLKFELPATNSLYVTMYRNSEPNYSQITESFASVTGGVENGYKTLASNTTYAPMTYTTTVTRTMTDNDSMESLGLGENLVFRVYKPDGTYEDVTIDYRDNLVMALSKVEGITSAYVDNGKLVIDTAAGYTLDPANHAGGVACTLEDLNIACKNAAVYDGVNDSNQLYATATAVLSGTTYEKTYTELTTANADTTLGELFQLDSYNLKIAINDSIDLDQTYSADTKLSQVIADINNVNYAGDFISATLEDGFIKLTDGTSSGSDNIVISGALAEALGICNISDLDQHKTSGTLTGTYKSMTLDSTMGELGVTNAYAARGVGLYGMFSATVNAVDTSSLTDIASVSSLTANKTYKVTTTEGLKKMASLCTSSTYSTCTFVLASDIDMSGVSWTSTAFYGTLNGNGYVIKNLATTGNGIFTNLYGTVKNLGLVDININTSQTNAGAIAGQSIGATIENCWATGSIRSTSTTGANVGGLVGNATYTGSKGTKINSCWTNVDISVSFANAYIGGLVGTASGNVTFTIANSTSYIEDGFAQGVSASNTNTGGLWGGNNSSYISVSNNSVVATNSGVDNIYYIAGNGSSAFSGSISYSSNLQGKSIGPGSWSTNSSILTSNTRDAMALTSDMTVRDVAEFCDLTNVTCENSKLSYSGNALYVKQGLQPSTNSAIFNNASNITTPYSNASITATTTFAQYALGLHPSGAELAGIENTTVVIRNTADGTEKVYVSKGSDKIVNFFNNMTGMNASINASGQFTWSLDEGYEITSLTSECGHYYSFLESFGMGLSGSNAVSDSNKLWTTTTKTETTDIQIEDLVGMNGGDWTVVNSQTGATSTINYGPGQSLQSFLDSLEAAGITYSISADGKITLNQGNNYIKVGEDDALWNALFGDSEAEDFTTISGGAGTMDDSDVLQVTLTRTIDYDTTLGMLTTSNYDDLTTKSITIISNGTTVNTTTTSSTRVGDILTWLSDNGISADIVDGKITLNPTEDCYISYMGGAVTGVLGLNGATFTTTRAMTSEDTLGEILTSYPTTAASATERTITLKDGSSKAFSHTDTIGDVIVWLAQNDIEADIQDGQLIVYPSSDNYITSIGAALKNALGLQNYNTYSETATSSGMIGYNPSSGSALTKTDTNVAPTTDTTLGELGLGSSETMTVIIGMTDGTGSASITFSDKDTLGDLADTLAAYNINVFINRDGKLQIKPIIVGSGYYYVKDITNIDKILSTEFTDTYTTTVRNASTATKFRDLAFSNAAFTDTAFADRSAEDRTIKIFNGEEEVALTVSAGYTIDSILGWMTSHGINAGIAGGKVSITPSYGCYITYMGDAVADALNLENITGSGTVTTNTTQTITPTYNANNGSILTHTNSVVMTTTHTLKDLKIGTTTAAGDVGADKKYTIAIGGTNSGTLTFTQDSTVDDILTSLAGYGIVGNVIDGKLTLTPTDGNYITAIETALANALKIPTAGGSYSTTNTSAPATINYDTTLGQIGIFAVDGQYFITVVNNGTTSGTTVTTTTRVGDLLTWLSDRGISADIVDGKVTLNPSENAYILAMGDNLAGLLKIQTDDTKYYTSDTTKTSYTTSSGSILTDTNSINMTTTHSLRDLKIGTTAAAGDVGADKKYTIAIGGTNSGTLTFTQDSTVDDILTSLAGYGIVGNIIDGKLTLTPTDGNYITAIETALANALKIPTAGGSYSTTNTSAPATINYDTTFDNLSTTDTSNQWYITVVNNGTTSGTTVTTTTRVGDLLTWLSDRGISADIVDGKVTLNPSENAYILAMGDTLADALKIEKTDNKYYTSDTTKTSYTTSSGSILTDTNSINMTTTHSLRDLKIGTTAAAGDVGADKKYTIAIGGTNSGTLTFTQDSTVDDILTGLAGYGIVGNVIDGKLTLTPTDGNYITAIEKALADALEISATGTSYYDSTVKAQANYDTTLAQLNFTGANETITVVNEGTEKTTTVATTTKVGDLLTWLSDNGISADIINGKVTLNPTEGCYIKDIGNKLANALHISKNDTDYYTSTTTTIVSGFNPTTATIASTTTTGMMTTSSTLEQIEYTSNTAATITLNDGTVLNFTKDDTINDVLTALAAYNIAGDITNGDLTLTTNGDYYIADMNETLKQKLHLATDAGYKTITAIASSTTTLGKAFTNNATKTVADSITVFNGSTVASRTFATTDTIGDVLTWLADNGISADIINGKVTLNPTEGCYITYMGTDIADALNVSNNATSYSKTTTETTGYNASQGEILTDTITTGLMKTESTLKQLGVANGSYTITIAGEGAGSITFNQDATVDDILTGLAGFGIVGNVVDGKLTLTSVDGNYITGMTAGLATAIGMSGKIGEDKSYNSTVTSITTETTMKEANTGFTTGTETIKVFNGSSSITFTTSATTTIGDILTWLSDNGISADVIDGKVTLNPTEGCYIESVGTKTAAALGITGATHYTRPSTTIGYNQTSDSLTDTFTVSMTTASTLAQIGVDDGSVITVVHEGKEHTIATRADMTVDDLLTTLAGYGISGEVKNGILTLNGTNDSYILKVGATENADTDFETVFGFDDGKDKTYQTYTVTVTPGSSTTSDSIDRIYTVSMTATSTMEELYDYSSLSTADGTIKGIYNGVEFTVNVTKDMTVGEVISALAAYGISGTIKDGKLTLTPAEGSYITDISTNVLNALKLEEGLGKTYNTTITKGTKDVEWTDTLGSLTNASGGKLISTFGSIYVYHDGTRTAVAISANDTVNDLAAKLAPYDIDVVLNEGKLYLDGDNNSYVEDIGSANICAGLGINGTTNWKTLYDSKTEVLTYEVDGFETATGDTAVTDLYVVNGSGNTVHAGVTEGAYSVFSRGVQTYETITDETTVDDLIATMGTYGLIGNQATDGSIAVGADHETYLATSATGDDTSMVANLFAEWDFVNIYTTKGLEVPQDVTIAITETTKLADLDLYDYDGDGDDDGYKAGKITVVKDGVQTDITLTADDTVGTLMNELALFGFESTINDDGQLIIKTTGDSMLLADTSNNAYSNALGMLGVSADKWIKTNSYLSDELVSVVTTSTLPTAMTRDSLLSEIGVSTGEYYIYKDGVKYTALISSDETLGSFIDTLATFGIQANIVTAPDGSSSVLQIIGDGSSYVAESVSTVNKSNVVQKLFPNSVVSSYDYSSEMKTELITSTYASATLDLELSYYDTPTKKAQGDLVLNIDGVENVIKITADDTFDSLIEKFQSLGLEASLSNGTFMIQSGYKELFIDTGKSTSKLVETLGLQFNNDLGGYVASNTEVQQTVWEEDDLSVANYATDSTTMKLLNITSGTLSVFRNGERATINLDENDTFTILRSKISSEFSDLDIRFENGYIEFYSKTGQAVEVGATTDTSNFSAICGLVNDKSGSVKSARELFCVNGDSKVTNAGLFRRGTVTKGTFTVGTAEFTIDENTTMQSLISQINAREDANATAYWDSIDGKLVIKSRTTGSSFINIEAGSSNFTDIMGYTTSEWGNGATQAATKTQLDIELQDVGENAIFSINGTQYSSTSNTIGSDISRIAGVTINLKGVSNGETVELVIEKDKETVANAVSDIVDSYNELMENVSKEIAKDGQLHDQTSLKLLRNRLRSLMTSSLPGVTGVYKNLDSIGIEFEKASGTNLGTENVDMLYFNKDKFISAFDSDLDSMKELLVGTDTIGNRGIFLEIKNVLETSLMGASGYFASADRSYGKQIDRLNEKIKKANEAVSRYQERLEAKFSAMDMLIANIQNQYSSFLG